MKLASENLSRVSIFMEGGRIFLSGDYPARCGDILKDLDSLLDHLIEDGYLVDNRLELAFQQVPLDVFLPQGRERDAAEWFYSDRPIPFIEIRTGHKTISAPHMISIMVQELHLRRGMDVLVLGAKSGYISALIAEMIGGRKGGGGFVYIMENNLQVAEVTEENLLEAGYERVTSVLVRDPLLGLPNKGPWDRILVTGQVPDIPTSLLEQLEMGGFLLAPIGDDDRQEFTKITKTPQGFAPKPMGGVLFGSLESECAERLPHRTVEFSGVELHDFWEHQEKQVVIQVAGDYVAGSKDVISAQDSVVMTRHSTPPPSGYPAPAGGLPPPPSYAICDCGAQAEYIQQYRRFYCEKCRRYVE